MSCTYCLGVIIMLRDFGIGVFNSYGHIYLCDHHSHRNWLYSNYMIYFVVLNSNRCGHTINAHLRSIAISRFKSRLYLVEKYSTSLKNSRPLFKAVL